MKDQEMKSYNIFINNHPPQDFLKLLTNANSNSNSPSKHKETDDGINISSHLKFLEDGPIETVPPVGERRYANIAHSLSMGERSLNSEMAYLNVNQAQTNNEIEKRKQIFFDDMINDIAKTPEMKLFSSGNESAQDDNQLKQVQYANSSLPPGLLTPTKYAQYVKELQVSLMFFHFVLILFNIRVTCITISMIKCFFSKHSPIC